LMRCAVLMILCWPLAVLADGAKPEKLDPDLPYQAKKTNPVTYEVDFSAIITAPYHTKVLKVWLPLPQPDPGLEVEEGNTSTFPMKVIPKVAKEAVFGNKFAHFEFDHPEGAQMLRHTFKIKVWELRWDVDPQKVEIVKEWPDRFRPFLTTEKQAVVVND